MVEALCKSQKVAGWLTMGSFGFLIDLIFRQHYGPGVDSAYNINEYQEYLRG
jgi:formylmethanofuran dehydrogenase subunit E-like metal-binding protein